MRALVLLQSALLFCGCQPSHASTPTEPRVLQGVINITQNGFQLTNTIVNGQINIQAYNVTVSNCTINADGYLYGIKANFYSSQDMPFTGVLLKDNVITHAMNKGILAQHAVIEGNDISLSGNDGIFVDQLGHVTIRGNWIHDLGTNPTAHADGIQLVGGTNFTIVDNEIMMLTQSEAEERGWGPQNACIFGETNFNPLHNILVEGNCLRGGIFSLWLKDQDPPAAGQPYHGHPTGIRVRRNGFAGGTVSVGLFNFSQPAFVEESCLNYFRNTGGEQIVALNNLGAQGEISEACIAPVSGYPPPECP